VGQYAAATPEANIKIAGANTIIENTLKGMSRKDASMDAAPHRPKT
jgi:hypothetical protein